MSKNNVILLACILVGGFLCLREVEVLYDEMYSYIDYKVDPCVDFYEFACGSWSERMVRQNKIKEKEESNVFTVQNDIIEEKVKKIIRLDSDNPNLQQVSKYFASCMDENGLERNYKSIFDFFAEINLFGEVNTKFNLTETMIKTVRYFTGVDLLVSIDIMSDHLNSSKKIVKIDQGGLGLHNEMYIYNEAQKRVIDSYTELIEGTFSLLSQEKTNLVGEKVNVSSLSEKIIKFETKIARCSSEIDYHRISLKELYISSPQFNWVQFLNAVFDGVYTFTEEDHVLSVSKEYLYKVFNLIQSTNQETLRYYAIWRVMQENLPMLSCAYRRAHNVFLRANKAFNSDHTTTQSTCSENVANDLKLTSREEYCVSLSNSQFGLIIGAEYLRREFSNETLKEAKFLVGQILNSLKKRMMGHKNWIFNSTLTKVIEKLDSIKIKVGYPEYIFNSTYMEDKFKNLTIDSDFLLNSLSIDRHFNEIKFRSINQQDVFSKDKWYIFPQTINAMYLFSRNEIVIPAGILRPPFFYTANDSVILKILSFGSLGSIIGHELTHAFDSSGRKFDSNGHVVKEWWDSNSVFNFNKKAICFLNQYNSLLLNGERVDGDKTLAENIADNGGLQAAYDAFSDYINNLIGENVSESEFKHFSQMFFLSYAQQYCGVIDASTQKMNLLFEIHSPFKIRVNGTINNTPQFYAAFDCPYTPPAANTCVLW